MSCIHKNTTIVSIEEGYYIACVDCEEQFSESEWASMHENKRLRDLPVYARTSTDRKRHPSGIVEDYRYE